MNQGSSFQVAVIGGGITGASAANHLAAAGFRTVLLERGDFASGTSSRSSRLQHCGLTYFSPGRSIWNFLLNPRMAIEHLELARRAMRDRSRFVRATPERVRPVRFYTPLYRNDGIPAWKARLGFRLLELLDPGGVPLDFELLGPAEAASEPALRHLRDRQDLVGAMKFTEYQFDWPERICLDTVLNARDCGAQVRNYAEVVAIGQVADGGWQLDVADRRCRAGDDKVVSTVAADCIVNATGAWVDETASRCGLSVPRVNQGLKGTNVVVRLPDEFRGLAVETALPDGNPFYVIPWGDLHYFGPRDEPCDPTPDGFRADEPTILALLQDFSSVFPSLPIAREDVLYSWAGVRPRTARAGHPDGCEAVLLHDQSKPGGPPYYTYTGGLLMTHRNAGASIAEAVSKRIRPERPSRPISYDARMTKPSSTGDHSSLGETGIGIEELRRAARGEMVFHLDDLLFRRFPLGWSERHGLDIARPAAEAIADIVGWSPDEVSQEVTRYNDLVAREFGRAAPCI